MDSGDSFNNRGNTDNYLLAGRLRLAVTVILYSASLKANKNAAVITLCVIFGPIPRNVVSGAVLL